MSFSRAFQWYHSHLDPIWPDGTFKTRWRCNNGQPMQRLFFQQLVAEAIINKCSIKMQILKRFFFNVSQETKGFVFLYFIYLYLFLSYHCWHMSYIATKSILSHGMKLSITLIVWSLIGGVRIKRNLTGIRTGYNMFSAELMQQVTSPSHVPSSRLCLHIYHLNDKQIWVLSDRFVYYVFVKLYSIKCFWREGTYGNW